MNGSIVHRQRAPEDRGYVASADEGASLDGEACVHYDRGEDRCNQGKNKYMRSQRVGKPSGTLKNVNRWRVTAPTNNARIFYAITHLGMSLSS
jgi:hypothetical protein